MNGDPSVDAPLSERGRDQARLLGQQLGHVGLDLCVCTRFPRTRETAELAVGDRDVPLEVEPLLDDVDIGELEGLPLGRYHEVKREVGRKQPFPGGESLDAAALRYARGFATLARSRRGTRARRLSRDSDSLRAECRRGCGSARRPALPRDSERGPVPVRPRGIGGRGRANRSPRHLATIGGWRRTAVAVGFARFCWAGWSERRRCSRPRGVSALPGVERRSGWRRSKRRPATRRPWSASARRAGPEPGESSHS